MMWLNVQMQSMSKKILNYSDWLDQLWFMMKTRHDKDMIVHISVFYVKNDI